MCFFEPDTTKHCYLHSFHSFFLIPPLSPPGKHCKILCLSTSPLKNLAQTASSSQLQKQTMLTSAFFPFTHSILRTLPRRVKMSLTPATPLCIIAFALHRHFSHWLSWLAFVMYVSSASQLFCPRHSWSRTPNPIGSCKWSCVYNKSTQLNINQSSKEV